MAELLILHFEGIGRRIEHSVSMLSRGETIHAERQRRVPASKPEHHR